MKTLFEDLKTSIACKNEDAIKRNLQAILLHNETLQITRTDYVLIQTLFKHSSKEVLICTVELMAEIAKLAQNREILTNKVIVSFLLKFLDNEDSALRIQACRALGNICYENGAARELIGKRGLKQLISSINGNKVFKNTKLESVSFGFMLNLLMENEELQKEAVEDNIIELIETALREQDSEACNDYCLHLLSVLNLLVEHMHDNNLSTSLCSLLVKFLRNSSNIQVAYYSLEILHEQAENEDTKLFLAKEGLCELVIDLIDKYKDTVDDEETRTALKMACDIIVLILTGDDPMILLYRNGEGVVYKSMLQWINSNDVDLSSTGILAVGNFARNDTHCIQMVHNGIAKQLLELLSVRNINKEDIKIQHAVLSALRNLVILPENKVQILEEGLISTLYPMLSSNHSPVIFKLLGTFRIIADGQEKAALDLIMRRDLLEKIVEFYFNSDHLGVRGEACRLLAWLTKNCHSSEPYSRILDVQDCIKCLVEMIMSNHGIMQNEAFFAINLICVRYLNVKPNNTTEINLKQKLDKALVEANIGESLKFLINKYKDKFDRETLSNLLTLLTNLLQFENLFQQLKNSNFKASLSSLLEGNSYEMDNTLQLLLSTIDSH